jgi:hypothetical protein
LLYPQAILIKENTHALCNKPRQTTTRPPQPAAQEDAAWTWIDPCFLSRSPFTLIYRWQIKFKVLALPHSLKRFPAECCRGAIVSSALR